MATQDKTDLAETFWALVFLLVIVGAFGLIVWTILPDRLTDKIKYSAEYSVEPSQIHWNDKPTDCDFMHAPLGEKSCHYKKTVSAYNAAGDLVGEDEEGKTRSVVPGNPRPKIKSIEIGWIKVTD
jgi:hypothetical protein